MLSKKEKIYKSEIPRKEVIIPGDSSELPDDFYSINLINQRKTYKLRVFNYFRMFPSDLTGSLDVFFLNKLLGVKGKF